MSVATIVERDSAAVAALAAEAGRVLALSREDVELVRRDGLVHVLGRLGVSN
jgi:HD-GYP domain-containing protein (c-di-GMP phosphodiesterase class II)